jgi:Family of unknown function (DUF695)/Regulator of ribonuclease activity B
MKKKYVILSILLFSRLVSFSQADNWEVYLAEYEKGVGSTVVNMSLVSKAPLKPFSYLLKTGVKLLHCKLDGLPEHEEFDMLYKIADEQKAIIDATTKNKAAGTFSYQCERTDYYYITDTGNIRKLLEAAYQKKFANYSYSIIIKPDENWDAYLKFLYPNEETLAYMGDEKVIRGLQDAGDDLSKPRQVDHWLYFKTEADRNLFTSYAIKEKYKIESKEFVKDAALKYQLQISRIDKVDIASINPVTTALTKKAKELNGTYDGWETFVIKSKEN